MTNLKKNLFFYFFIISLFSSIFIFSKSLDYYFFQDDFFEIRISQADNLAQYLNFFSFRNDIIAYRPISLQNYFYFSSIISPLNPVGFRIVSFTFFMMTGFLIAKVISKITKSSNIGLLTASFWFVSSIHFEALTWIAAAYNILGTFFWFLTSLLFLNWISGKQKLFYFLTVFSFILTLCTFEFSVSWTPVFVVYYFLFKSRNLKEIVKVFSPFVLLSLIYLALRFFYIKIPAMLEYETTFNASSLKAYFWYIIWAFNVPEEFKKQVLKNLIIFNPKFVTEYLKLILVSFGGMLIVAFLGILLPVFYSIQRKINLSWRIILFSFLFFSICIFPVLVLPNHTFSMYLTLSSVGIYLLLAYLLIKTEKSILVLLVYITFLITSVSTVNFYRKNSYFIRSQEFARTFANNIKKAFPELADNSMVYYPVNSNMDKQAILDQEAIKALYNNPTISIYYNKEDFKKAVLQNNKRYTAVYTQ